ncbi:cytochrome P450 [Nocardiopsis algeriensis]|uniref:cytochrome P450 n=1 Tax=Nocardiopsis algeriensis TaxID=1478215 RepID=UPI003B437317
MTLHSPDGSAVGGCPVEVFRLGGDPGETGGSGDHDDWWDRLREQHGPVVPVALESGVTAWLLLGYHENLTVLQSPHLFSRDTRRWREVAEGRVDLSAGRPALSWRPNALYADGSEHARLRAPIADSIARLDMGATSQLVRQIADDLVDAFVARGSADLIAEYADPLPVLVINRLCGLPDSYGRMLGDLTSIIFGEDPREAEDAVIRLQQYFAGLVVRKRKRPGADLVSWMLEHPAGLTEHEVAHQAALINNSSHQTTTHLIGNTMRTLLTDTRIRSAYADARISAQDLLDHVMWTDTPFQILPARFALQNMLLGNARVRAGDALLIGFHAAHRDPAVYKGRREETGVAGGSRAHLMFGAGPHACPARDLARMIAATAVEVLNERLSGLRSAVAPEELRSVRSPFVRGVEALPVLFRPGNAVGEKAKGEGTGTAGRNGTSGHEKESEDDILGRLLRWWRGSGRGRR